MKSPREAIPPDTFNARLYTLLHKGNPGDVEFYRSVCAGGRRVLEVGCGAGRIMLPLLRAGHEVVGLDLHPGMLAQAQTQIDALPAANQLRATLVEGDMLTPPVEGLFDRIIVPYNTLYVLPDDAAVRRCLTALRALCAPGGQLALDGYSVGDPREMGPDEGELDWLASIEDEGGEIEVYEHDRHDPKGRNFKVSYLHIFDEAQGRERVTYTLRHHYQTRWSIRSLLNAAGWRMTHLFGDFERAPFEEEESEHLVVIASPR